MKYAGRLVPALFLLITGEALAGSEQVSPACYIDLYGFTVTSSGTVTYFPPDCLFCGSGYITGTHVINDGAAGTIASASFGPYEQGSQSAYLTYYSGSVSAGTEYNHCYRARLEATGEYGTNQASGSNMRCAPPDPNAQQIDNSCTGSECAPSPIVINFERGGYQLSGTNSPVLFDIAASGSPMRISWTASGADEAFLWLDRNHNGVVDSGAELFGNATPLIGGTRAANGFESLREFDDNHDGVIDDHDAVWARLSLWRDSNHDGVSQPSEIMPVTASPLTAISLDYHWTGRRDSSGNTYRYQSQVWFADGARIVPRPVYDIFFAVAQ